VRLLALEVREDREVQAADGLAELGDGLPNTSNEQPPRLSRTLPNASPKVPDVRKQRSRVGVSLEHDADGLIVVAEPVALERSGFTLRQAQGLSGSPLEHDEGSVGYAGTWR
jgi:hypothetical protein